MYGYNVQLLNEVTGDRVASTRKGCWWWKGRCRRGYSDHLGRRRPLCEDVLVAVFRPVYATFDWGIRDADGYHFISGALTM